MGYHYVITSQSINRSTKKCFLRENTDIEDCKLYSLVGIEVIRESCSIHIIRISLILLLGKEVSKFVITTVTQRNQVFWGST